jgi:Neuraminidase (sialidase)
MVWCSTAGAELDPTNKIWLAYSKDAGKTWGEPVLFAASTIEGKVLCPSCHTHTSGRVFVFFNLIHADRYDLVFQTSDDSGQSWGPRTRIEFAAKVVALQDSPIRLADGSIVLAIQYDRPRDGKEHYVATVLRSTDGGNSWQRGGDMEVASPRGAMEPNIAQLSDGRLYCLLRTKSGWLYEAWSKDTGTTWTKPRQSPFPSPESTPMLRRLASGNLVLVWNNNTLSQGANVPRYPLSLAMSEDDGQTWPFHRMIQTTWGQRQLSNHGVFQTDRGDILVTTNHWAGTRDGKDYGTIDLARFDEDWIRSRLSPERWNEQPSATGGVRLDRDGVLLVAGANNGDQTLLTSKTPLPARCRIEFEASDEERDLKTYTGFFLGGAPFGDKPWFAFIRENNAGQPALHVRSSELGAKWLSLASGEFYQATKIKIELDDGGIRYTDSIGTKSDWQALPKELKGPLTWGLFARNNGTQARLRLKTVVVEKP